MILQNTILLMLSRSSDFVHQFGLMCGLMFATCKSNYVFFSKSFISYNIFMNNLYFMKIK